MNHRNMFFSRPAAVIVALSIALLTASVASAVGPLNPGTTEYNPVLSGPFPFFTPSYTSGPVPANYVQVTSATVPYNYNGTLSNAFSGTVTTTVYQDTTTKMLAFSYVFNNLTPFPGAPLTDIVRATINDPSDPWLPITILAAGADPNSGGHSTPIVGTFGGWNNGMPFDITRSATDSGVAVEFNPLNSGTQLDSTPNDQSALIWFATNATLFNITNVSFSDNGHVGTTRAYVPSTIQGPFLPEPSTFVLLGLGSIGGVIAVWRRRRTS